MNEVKSPSSYPQSIAFIGNYLPRRCGIATFTSDLLTAVSKEAADAQCWAVAMNDVPEGYHYPSQVRFEVESKNLSDYHLAADFMNINQVEMVNLQFEYGLFGGNCGSFILELLHGLRIPLVTTLHTVLLEPDPKQKAVMEDIGRTSDAIVVMSRKAVETLKEIYSIPQEKIHLIYHGIPDIPFVDPNYYKDLFGVEGRRVMLTFGLVSPGKGIEQVIDALPDVVKKHPDIVYIVLGATHPHIIKEHGESYRLSLQTQARKLGVEEHLIFHNRFVELKELCEFIGAADLYVTPYLSRDQIVSGTLSYALGAGKATISTPYWYAEEMLAEERGRIVPFNNPHAIAEQVVELLENEAERHAMRKRAYTFCRPMVWDKVARQYLDLFMNVKGGREKRPKITFRARTLGRTIPDLPRPCFEHIQRLTDDTGILQHAKYIVPDRSFGYCTDDNARALIAVLMAQGMVPDDTTLIDLACRYLGYLQNAFNETNGHFRNFMTYDRQWLDESGSEDSHSRAIWGLGVTLALSRSPGITNAAYSIFEPALPVLADFTSPRAWAYGLLGIHVYLQKFGGDRGVRNLRSALANQLFDLYLANASKDWPWIEETLAYANGIIPQALLLSGQWLQREDMVEAGLKMLHWLLKIQTEGKGHFVPIGNHGWFSKGGQKARFDQQPIEAQHMIEACTEAYYLTKDKKWLDEARNCFDWFMGRNDLNISLIDYKTGGCCDGLTADGANQNQGAESTVCCMISLLRMHILASTYASTAAN